jgi:hypothetical protein
VLFFLCDDCCLLIVSLSVCVTMADEFENKEVKEYKALLLCLEVRYMCFCVVCFEKAFYEKRRIGIEKAAPFGV